MSSPLAQLISDAKGLPSAFRKEHPIGTVWAGQVVRVLVRNDRDDDGNPKTWDDGNPMQSVVVAIQTNQRDPERPDDDGVRGIYIKWWGKTKESFLEAIRKAGVSDIEAGGMFAAQYTGDGPQPSNKMHSRPKLWAFEYKAPSGISGLLGAETFAAVDAATPAPQQQSNAAVEAMLGGGAPASQPVSPPMSGMLAGQDHKAPQDVPVSVPQDVPASQPVSPAPADPQAQLAQVKGLIAMGLTDAQIAAALSVDANAVMAIRSLP